MKNEEIENEEKGNRDLDNVFDTIVAVMSFGFRML